MKWPFVPRSLHDERTADLRSEITDLRRRLDESEAKRESLTQTIVDMKVAGGSIPRIHTGERLEQKPRDEFEKAVDANPMCARDSALRRQQLSWARKAIEKGADRDSVLARLQSFGSIELVEDEDEEDEDEALLDEAVS